MATHVYVLLFRQTGRTSRREKREKKKLLCECLLFSFAWILLRVRSNGLVLLSHLGHVVLVHVRLLYGSFPEFARWRTLPETRVDGAGVEKTNGIVVGQIVPIEIGSGGVVVGIDRGTRRESNADQSDEEAEDGVDQCQAHVG